MLDKSRIILFRLFYLKEDTAAWFVRSPMMTCNCHPQNGYLIQNDLWRASRPTTAISWQQVGIGKKSRTTTIVWLKAFLTFPYHRYNSTAL